MRRLITLVVVLSLAYLLRGMAAPAPQGALAAMLLGFTLLASYLAGAVAGGLGLPRVTGYVLLGIGVGPYGLGILDAPIIAGLRTIDEIALALIALTAGGELRIGLLRRLIRPIAGVGLGVMAVVVVGTAVLVLAARPFVPFLAERPLEFAVAVALLLGIWSANSSPDATIAVINETGAEGDLTETILGVTIFKDVLVIIAFAGALSLAHPLVDPGAAFETGVLFEVAREVLGGLLLGGAAGWGFSFYLQRIGARSILATLVFTYVLTLLAAGLHVELLLAAVAAGFVIENFSAAGDQLIDAIEANALVVFALFFAVAGSALNVGALVAFWPVALVVVVARTFLTWAGARAGARWARAPEPVGRLAWLGLISQAGVTLGLALLVGDAFPDWGDRFVAMTAAIIIFHLLLGPVLLKFALDRAGETRGGGRKPGEDAPAERAREGAPQA